ncbi:hypothetical protein [Mycolicibacterium phage Kashi_SSH1]|nr:hypothetical protein [Mycolicibacterium phage Kashi_SSH1]
MPSSSRIYVSTRDVPCPHCGVEAGQYCVRMGASTPKHHQARVRAAKQKQELLNRPVMQEPGYVHYERKHVVARNVRLGDRIAETQTRPTSQRWAVTEIRDEGYVIKVRYYGRHRFFTLGAPREQVWIDRPLWRIDDDGNKEKIDG